MRCALGYQLGIKKKGKIMKESYTIAMRVVFESTVEVEVEADSEDEAVELAHGAVDVAEAHAEACHFDTDYWSTISGPYK